jgi:hypothetical protein
MTNDRPTRRIPSASSTGYRLHRTRGVLVTEAGGAVTVSVGKQTFRLSKREALELTVALVKLTQHTG